MQLVYSTAFVKWIMQRGKTPNLSDGVSWV